MGYYTEYELDIDPPTTVNLNDISTDILHDIAANKDLGITKYFSHDNPERWFEQPVKWYDSNRDMREVSLLYPDVLFTLLGKGERNDDIWSSYYKGGKGYTQDAIITYPVFDESKLE